MTSSCFCYPTCLCTAWTFSKWLALSQYLWTLTLIHPFSLISFLHTANRFSIMYSSDNTPTEEPSLDFHWDQAKSSPCRFSILLPQHTFLPCLSLNTCSRLSLSWPHSYIPILFSIIYLEKWSHHLLKCAVPHLEYNILYIILSILSSNCQSLEIL